ncbi:NXPE family member 2-like [Pelobates fuscus]|uniref:NXPE family member 2-like n=1 Tax=Pelobates fuscus TaxID=191477 RepID=UPI002FE4B20C
MSCFITKGYKTSLVVSLMVSLMLGFTYHRIVIQSLKPDIPQIYSKHTASFMDSYGSNVSHISEKDFEINQVFETINNSITSVPFTHFNLTTSAKKSRATIFHYGQQYCNGDSLTVRVDMFNYLGQRKTYGGDFLTARIYSTDLGAAASGRVEDFNNGSYNIHFILSWEGNVKISIILYHPSEGVSALWRARNMGYKNIIFTGKFLYKSQEIETFCGFNLESQEDKCVYADKRDGEFFYCIKPPNVPCEALISMKSDNHHSYLTKSEMAIFTRSNIGVTIPMDTGSIAVASCQRNITDVKPKCRIGMPMPYPSGYFLNNVWHSNFCNLSSYEPLSHIDECLTGKLIYLMGDSTLRQWIEYFQKHMKSLKFFNLPGHGLHKRYLALDIDRNIYIQWKKHGHPFVSTVGYTVKDCAYIAREIDELPGSPNTIIVITLGQHFRGFPVHLFIRRLLNVRRAIERIFLRSPETKVFLKVENSRDMNTDVERISDFHGYIQYLILKDIFKRHNVGVIDAWEMTIAFASYNLHPPETVIRNQINTFLSYLC